MRALPCLWVLGALLPCDAVVQVSEHATKERSHERARSDGVSSRDDYKISNSTVMKLQS